jgi:hypothetical protein
MRRKGQAHPDGAAAVMANSTTFTNRISGFPSFALVQRLLTQRLFLFFF